MGWRINDLPQRRSPEEQAAYVAGFRAGVGMARKYVAQERPLEDLDLLMETLEESVVQADQPRYEHDCDVCIFLGYVEGLDAYVCPQQGMPTVILRRSGNGPDYDSGRELVLMLPEEMRQRAVKLMSNWVRTTDE